MKIKLDTAEPTPFEKFDQLMRSVIAVPKSVVVKAEQKERLKNHKKREARKDKTAKS